MVTSPKTKTIALSVFIAIALALPWLVGPYVLQIFIVTMTYGMLGLSFLFTLKVGLWRFDAAAWWGIGAYITAMLMLKVGLSFWACVPIAGLGAVVIGWLIFRIAVPRGMMVFLLFGMVTGIAIQQVFGSVDFFGGWGGTGFVGQPSIGSFAFDTKPKLYYLGLGFLGFNLICYWALYRSRMGRSWDAIGQSLRLARSVGLDVVKFRMANVLISNFFLALAGSYYMAYSLVAVPGTFSLAESMNVMMFVVVGGIAFPLWGPMVGAFILAFVPEYLRVAQEYEPIITAVVIILIIIFLPGGILGLVARRGRPWFAGRNWMEFVGLVVRKRRPTAGDQQNDEVRPNEPAALSDTDTAVDDPGRELQVEQDRGE